MLDEATDEVKSKLQGVSVVIPAFGDTPFLVETVVSVQGQENVTFEVIIVLDRPSLENRILVSELSNKYPNIVVIESTSPGISDALNLGILNSSYPFIARMDSDDLMKPNRLSAQLAFLQSHPEIDCVGTQIEFFGEFKQIQPQSLFPTKPSLISKGLKIRNVVAHPSVMFRKEKVNEVGLYRSKFNGGEDYDLWMRLDTGRNIANINSALTQYRIHEGQETKKNSSSQLNLDNQIRKTNLLENSNVGDQGNLRIFVLRRKIQSAEVINKLLFTLKTSKGFQLRAGLILNMLNAFWLSPTLTCSFIRIFILPRRHRIFR
jgi:glycosyltransferase involved in cell wall biosynthesis